MMRNIYEYRRLPFCDALMESEDMGYEIFQLELQPDGKEYLVYIRKPCIVPGATYVITEDNGNLFRKGDHFTGLPNGMLEHCHSGWQFEFTQEWKNLILMIKD